MSHRVLISVFILFIAIAIGMIMHVKNLQENVLMASALNNAKLYSDAITEFRSIYTSEVVTAAKAGGLEVTHDYINKKAIPLPATLSILLGKRIGEKGSGATAQLYSPYPFPWRKNTGGLTDDFAKRAWEQLKKSPDQPYFEFSKKPGSSILRYAVSDVMRSSCLHCHNTHQSSARHDWQAGDLRGVLEISVPLSSVVAQSNDDLKITIYSSSLLAILGVLGIFFLTRKHKQDALVLEKLSITDPLTGLFNQRELERALTRELNKIKRSKSPLTLVYFDIDKFKDINDKYGHAKGDEVLKFIGTIAPLIFREVDIICRYGGDEFCIVLPDCSEPDAIQACQRLIKKFHEQYPDYNLSIGIAETGADGILDIEELIKQVDSRMYDAKKETGSNISF